LKEGRFTAGEASLYADSQNQVQDFAAKILWLLEHPEERERMGVYGRARVQEKLAWRYSEAGLLAAYDRAFEKRAGGRQNPSAQVSDSSVGNTTVGNKSSDELKSKSA